MVIKHVLVSDHSKEGNLSDKYLPLQTFLLVSFEHILINVTSFMGIPNLVRILYGIFIEILKLHFYLNRNYYLSEHILFCKDWFPCSEWCNRILNKTYMTCSVANFCSWNKQNIWRWMIQWIYFGQRNAEILVEFYSFPCNK